MAETRTLEGPAGAQQTCRIVTPMSESVDAIDNVSFVIGRCETSSRATAYEERLQHAACIGVELTRAIASRPTSQRMQRDPPSPHRNPPARLATTAPAL